MTTTHTPSPFAGIPLSDYLRDGFALVLLLVSFALPWNYASHATGRVEVILITLLSVFSLSITYLARTGVFPHTVTVNTVWMLRLLANAPYVALVLTYIIIDAASGANYSAGGLGSGGLGFAAAFGITGAIIAAQPRQAETMAFVRGAPIAELWYRILVGFGAVAIITSLVSLILVLVRPGIGYAPPVSVISLVSSLLLNLAVIGLLYGAMMRRSEVGRLVALAVGIAFLGTVLIDLFSHFVISGGAVESLNTVGFGALVLCALAGLASSPPVRIAMEPTDPLRRWLNSGAVLFVAIAGVAAFIAFLTILALASGQLGTAYTGFGIGTIVIVVAIGLVAIVARAILVGNPTGGRTLTLLLTGLILMLGVVHIVVSATGSRVGIVDIVFALGLPLSIGCFLLIPAAVRDHYGVTGPAAGVANGDAHPSFVERLASPVAAPSAPPAAAAAAPAGASSISKIALALDPSTPAATLFQLAQDDPDLRPYLAANPSTYPDLLNWLGGLNDPAINAALDRRA